VEIAALEIATMSKTTTKTPPPSRRILTRAEAAEYLAVSQATLSRWAAERRGPAFIKLADGDGGAVRYAVDALDDFIATRTKSPK
jgi:predicted DNA-binding transcriptional regulator AlpA